MKTTVEIKKMGINGEGIGYINRKIVFIKGALLNEEVEIDAKQYNNKNYYLVSVYIEYIKYNNTSNKYRELLLWKNLQINEYKKVGTLKNI